MMKEFILEEFSDKTALLPRLVAETVILNRGLLVEEHIAFVDACETRTLANYNKNKLFRKQMNSSKGRDWLYSFVSHWLEGYTKNPEKYLAEITS